MSWVVDASVAVKWYVRENLHEEARALLDNETVLVAPDWIVQEVAHAAFRKWRDNEIAQEQARTMIAMIPATFTELHISMSLVTRALEIAFVLRHPIYDCLYLACAEAAEAPVITADHRFYRAAIDGGFAKQIALLRPRGRSGSP